ncbi:MAG: molecular chaperone DnaK, partial [Intestinibacter sp.]|nr:molecular chaperone DnaK [Intestinibacter sp.]
QGLDQSKESIDRAQKSEIKSELRTLKRLVKKAKPEKITDIQIGEIRQAKDKLEMTARNII